MKKHSVTDESPAGRSIRERLAAYPFIEALLGRRSRRFGLGMKIEAGPLAFQSRHPAVGLSEDEEAALVFAACGMTGHALLDLRLDQEGGGNILAGAIGRTVASGDAIQAVALAVINDRETSFVRRPRDFPATELRNMIELGQSAGMLEFYRRARVKLHDGRASPPLDPIFNLSINRWSAYAPGTTYFLPINELTFMYINGLLEVFAERTAAFVVDERAQFRPAGVARFARSRGGYLNDDPRLGRMATIQRVELMVTEFVALEQGMMLQNLGLMTQALGLGGFPNFANHEFGWFQALGFRMAEMPAGRFLGAGPIIRAFMKLTGRELTVPFPVGLEHQGEVLLRSYCPPYFPSMREAVLAVVEEKFGRRGVFRDYPGGNAWAASDVAGQIPRVSDACVAATIAYCEYVWNRYGRFPAYAPPFRTSVGYQACHVDAEFYERFYRPEALTATQREDFRRCVRSY